MSRGPHRPPMLRRHRNRASTRSTMRRVLRPSVMSHERALAKETERETVPTVAVINPVSEKPDEDLILPGSLQAYEESPIYARTSGYLVRWYKDIGSRKI